MHPNAFCQFLEVTTTTRYMSTCADAVCVVGDILVALKFLQLSHSSFGLFDALTDFATATTFVRNKAQPAILLMLKVCCC